MTSFTNSLENTRFNSQCTTTLGILNILKNLLFSLHNYTISSSLSVFNVAYYAMNITFKLKVHITGLMIKVPLLKILYTLNHVYKVLSAREYIFLICAVCVCLEISSHCRIFYSYGDVTIAGERLLILASARHLWRLSSESSLAY